MDGLVLNHFQGLMVILDDDVPTIEVCMEHLKAETYLQTFSIVSLHISQGPAGKGNGLDTLDEGGT